MTEAHERGTLNALALMRCSACGRVRHGPFLATFCGRCEKLHADAIMEAFDAASEAEHRQ